MSDHSTHEDHGDAEATGPEPSEERQPDWQQVVEDRLREAAYTAVGLGLFAYKYSEPRVRKAAEGLDKWREEHAQSRLADIERELQPVKSVFDKLVAEGRAFYESRSRQ